MDAVTGALPGLVSGAMPELPDVTGGAIPSAPAPTQTGPALPLLMEIKPIGVDNINVLPIPTSLTEAPQAIPPSAPVTVDIGVPVVNILKRLKRTSKQ